MTARPSASPPLDARRPARTRRTTPTVTAAAVRPWSDSHHPTQKCAYGRNPQTMTIPLPKTDVDWTALRNFAMLRGQLRVSLTPKCNEKCWFCHNEGDVPPPFTHLYRDLRPREREMTAEDFLNVLGGLMNAGLKRVYFTGGEPLLSPLARPVLTRLPEHGPDTTYTLITNGTLVRTHQEWLSTTALDKVKVSLHYFSDESLKAIGSAARPGSRPLIRARSSSTRRTSSPGSPSTDTAPCASAA